MTLDRAVGRLSLLTAVSAAMTIACGLLARFAPARWHDPLGLLAFIALLATVGFTWSLTTALRRRRSRRG